MAERQQQCWAISKYVSKEPDATKVQTHRCAPFFFLLGRLRLSYLLPPLLFLANTLGLICFLAFPFSLFRLAPFTLGLLCLLPLLLCLFCLASFPLLAYPLKSLAFASPTFVEFCQRNVERVVIFVFQIDVYDIFPVYGLGVGVGCDVSAKTGHDGVEMSNGVDKTVSNPAAFLCKPENQTPRVCPPLSSLTVLFVIAYLYFILFHPFHLRPYSSDPQ